MNTAQADGCSGERRCCDWLLGHSPTCPAYARAFRDTLHGRLLASGLTIPDFLAKHGHELPAYARAELQLWVRQ